jgi:hypothetical protein
MKFKFDTDGSMTVTDTVEQVDEKGAAVDGVTTRTMSAEQAKKHLPMFEEKMTVAEKAAVNK